jgi:hypothetical protein
VSTNVDGQCVPAEIEQESTAPAALVPDRGCMLTGVPSPVDPDPHAVIVARLALQAEEIRERTARVGLAQSRVGLATAKVTALGAVVAAMIGAVVFTLGVVSCDGDRPRHDAPAVSHHRSVPRKSANGSDSLVRRASDRLYPSGRDLGPQEAEALRLVEAQPGMTVRDLCATLGIGRARIWQIVSALERGRVHRAGDPPRRLGP